MKSCGGEREQPGGVAGAAADIEVGALVWVVRRNGSWWPGRILGMDELPEDCSIPPRHTVTPIKLLGRPDGSIDWYSLEKSKRVKPFRCGEFDECIENAKVQAHVQNMSQNEGKCACREYAIMHALEIEKSRFPPEGHLNTYGSCESINNQVSKPINQTTECSKAGTFSLQDHRRSKMKIISFIAPISKGSPKSDDNLLPLEHEATMKCHAPDSDVVELEARVEGAVCEPTDLENNIQVYDVEVTVLGNYTGLGLPLASLTSKSMGNPIKGYPVSVEVSEDYCSAASIDDHLPAIGNLECLLKSRVSLPQKKRSTRSKPGDHKKVNEHDLGKSSWPHAKKPAPDASPRKIQRLSSSLSNRRDHRMMQHGPLVGLMSPYYGWKLHQEEEIEEEEEDEEEVVPLHSATVHARENSKPNPVVEKGSLLRTHSPPGANCKRKAPCRLHAHPWVLPAAQGSII